jgi:Heavy metal associated domain 2
MRRHAYVVHHIPGRIRIKIVDVTPNLLDEVRGRLLGTRSIQTVQTNPATGSVLVLYSPGDGADIVDVVAARLNDLLLVSSDSKSHIGDYSTTATTLVAAVKEADDGLRARSGGLVDLKLLFPLSMVALAALTLPTSLQTPLWLSFLMFGYSSFESMHTGALEQPAGKSSEEHESSAASGAAQG